MGGRGREGGSVHAGAAARALCVVDVLHAPQHVSTAQHAEVTSEESWTRILGHLHSTLKPCILHPKTLHTPPKHSHSHYIITPIQGLACGTQPKRSSLEPSGRSSPSPVWGGRPGHHTGPQEYMTHAGPTTRLLITKKRTRVGGQPLSIYT